MVSERSLTSWRSSLSKSVTGCAGVRSTGSPNRRIGWMATELLEGDGAGPVFSVGDRRDTGRSILGRPRRPPHGALGLARPAPLARRKPLYPRQAAREAPQSGLSRVKRLAASKAACREQSGLSRVKRLVAS